MTLYRFAIALSDVDRSVYETLDLRVAQHPSESMRFQLDEKMLDAIAAGMDRSTKLEITRNDEMLYVVRGSTLEAPLVPGRFTAEASPPRP